MTSRESPNSSSKYDTTSSINSKPTKENIDSKSLKRDSKNLPLTASPFRNTKDKFTFEIKSNPTSSFQSLLLQEEIKQTKIDRLGNSNTLTVSKNTEPKGRRLTMIPSSETLSNKMPNFLMNYDDLLQMVTKSLDSKSSKASSSLKSNLFSPVTQPKQKLSMKEIRAEGKEEKKSSCISSLITAVKQKSSIVEQIQVKNEENEEERLIYLKSLTNIEEIRDFYENTEECLKRIAKLKVTPESEIEHLLVHLPFEEELKTKKLAVFDLDETLVHCEIKKPSKGEVQINVRIPSGAITKVGLNIRPFLKESLVEIKKNYVIIVYTASHQSYAESVLDYLDPEKELIQYRLYRHNCVRVKMESDFIYVKDMRIFKNVPMKDIIIIDNSALSFAFQLENGIPILPFYNNKEDNELNFLTHYLNHIAKSHDLREENRKNLKMDYFLHAAMDESSINEESEEENDVSIEKEYGMDKSEDKGHKTNSNTGLFALNICDQSQQSEEANNSFDNSLNTSDQKEDSHRKYPEGKKNSLLKGKLINNLVELKKSLEDNVNLSKQSK